MKCLIVLAALIVAAVAVPAPSCADALQEKVSPRRGTWTGVSNNYGGGEVDALGEVHGSYNMVYRRDDVTGAISDGTETFKSNAGQIDQTFSYDPASGWHVSVTATRDLAFLTSDTNGACYTGAFPRP